MDIDKFNDANRFAKRMKKLLNDASKCGLQFVIVDDSVYIGDSNIEATWESLVRNYKAEEFISCEISIPALGA